MGAAARSHQQAVDMRMKLSHGRSSKVTSAGRGNNALRLWVPNNAVKGRQHRLCSLT